MRPAVCHVVARGGVELPDSDALSIVRAGAPLQELRQVFVQSFRADVPEFVEKPLEEGMRSI